jgi:hypothetical protein
MKNLSGWIWDHASGGRALGAMVLWLMAASALFTLGPYAEFQTQLGRAPLEETVGFGVDDLMRQNAAFGENGRRSYIAFQVFDTVQAALFGFALWLANAAACKRIWPDRRRALVAALPLWGVAAEWIEDIALILLTLQGDAPNALLSTIAGIVAGLKMATVGLGAVWSLVLWLLAGWAVAIREKR